MPAYPIKNFPNSLKLALQYNYKANKKKKKKKALENYFFSKEIYFSRELVFQEKAPGPSNGSCSTE